MKKRKLYVIAEKYQRAVNLLDDAGIENSNATGYFSFDLLTAILTTAGFGLILMVINWLN